MILRSFWIHTLPAASDVFLRTSALTSAVGADLACLTSCITAPTMGGIGRCIDTTTRTKRLIIGTNKAARTIGADLSCWAGCAALSAVPWVVGQVDARIATTGLCACTGENASSLDALFPHATTHRAVIRGDLTNVVDTPQSFSTFAHIKAGNTLKRRQGGNTMKKK